MGRTRLLARCLAPVAVAALSAGVAAGAGAAPAKAPSQAKSYADHRQHLERDRHRPAERRSVQDAAGVGEGRQLAWRHQRPQDRGEDRRRQGRPGEGVGGDEEPDRRRRDRHRRPVRGRYVVGVAADRRRGQGAGRSVVVATASTRSATRTSTASRRPRSSTACTRRRSSRPTRARRSSASPTTARSRRRRRPHR